MILQFGQNGVKQETLHNQALAAEIRQAVRRQLQRAATLKAMRRRYSVSTFSLVGVNDCIKVAVGPGEIIRLRVLHLSRPVYDIEIHYNGRIVLTSYRQNVPPLSALAAHLSALSMGLLDYEVYGLVDDDKVVALFFADDYFYGGRLHHPGGIASFVLEGAELPIKMVVNRTPNDEIIEYWLNQLWGRFVTQDVVRLGCRISSLPVERAWVRSWNGECVITFSCLSNQTVPYLVQDRPYRWQSPFATQETSRCRWEDTLRDFRTWAQ